MTPFCIACGRTAADGAVIDVDGWCETCASSIGRWRPKANGVRFNLTLPRERWRP